MSTPEAQSRSRPVRYRLWSRESIPFGPFPTALAAAEWARSTWPDQVQDEGLNGVGWDIEAIRDDK